MFCHSLFPSSLYCLPTSSSLLFSFPLCLFFPPLKNINKLLPYLKLTASDLFPPGQRGQQDQQDQGDPAGQVGPAGGAAVGRLPPNRPEPLSTLAQNPAPRTLARAQTQSEGRRKRITLLLCPIQHPIIRSLLSLPFFLLLFSQTSVFTFCSLSSWLLYWFSASCVPLSTVLLYSFSAFFPPLFSFPSFLLLYSYCFNFHLLLLPHSSTSCFIFFLPLWLHLQLPLSIASSSFPLICFFFPTVWSIFLSSRFFTFFFSRCV